MFEMLALGLPGDVLGGLALTILMFFVGAISALVLGYLYAVAAVSNPRLGLILQTGSAVIRGIPLLLLVFLCSCIPVMPTLYAGLLGLVAYSFSHVGEIQRGFLAQYPGGLRNQARVMGIGSAVDWFDLRVRWVWSRALPVILTHWISLLKDTGALVVIGIGELTTVTKILSESTYETSAWMQILGMSAALYLLATVGLVTLIKLLFARQYLSHSSGLHYMT